MAGGINERLNLFCTKRMFALVRKNVFTLTSQMDVPFHDLLHKFMCERAHLEMFRKGRPLPNTKIKTQQLERSLDEPSVCHNQSTQIRFIHCHLIQSATIFLLVRWVTVDARHRLVVSSAVFT